MIEVIMPKMGDAMEEGTLIEWSKSEGETVKSGDIIGAIQTDKATLELEAPSNGILQGFLIQAGETVPVGKPIAAILKPDEELPEGWGPAKKTSSDIPESNQSKTPVASDQKQSQLNQPNAMESLIESIPIDDQHIKATPLAKKIAKEQNIDLKNIVGSGPNGRIVEKDVLKQKKLHQKTAHTSLNLLNSNLESQNKKTPLNKLRQVIGQRTQHSKQQVPHFYVTVEVDIEAILALRKQFEREESGKLSINDFVVKAAACALKDMPNVNTSLVANDIISYGDINIAIAVAIEEGLVVPVIKNADQMGLRQISIMSKDLAGKARSNKLSLDEMSGSTFCISNMGMFKVDNFIAIINEPNSAIIAVGSALKKPIVNENNEIEIRSRMNISGSFDHRILDGAIGAQFMNVLRNYLENPTRLLI